VERGNVLHRVKREEELSGRRNVQGNMSRKIRAGGKCPDPIRRYQPRLLLYVPVDGGALSDSSSDRNVQSKSNPIPHQTPLVRLITFG